MGSKYKEGMASSGVSLQTRIYLGTLSYFQWYVLYVYNFVGIKHHFLIFGALYYPSIL